MFRSMTLWRRLCVGLWLAAGMMPAAMAEDSSGDRSGNEQLLKTAFIFNFAKFTRWPDSEQRSTLSLCIAGEDELLDELERLKGKLIKGRPIAPQLLKNAVDSRNCDLLYVAKSEARRYPDLIRSVAGQATLTVSELPQFADNGGMIGFYREKGRIRFMINLGAARRAGLEISPNLLNLATVIGQ